MKALRSLALCAVLCGMTAAPLAAATLSNGSGTDGTVLPFGPDGSLTYGQVFTAPVTGRLTGFTLWLTGGVGEVFGGVGTWNGTPGFGTGFGSDTTLFTSPATASDSGGAISFATDIAVTAGSLYVAFLTVFGGAGSGDTAMPLSDSDDVAGIEYFVFNNDGSPFGNPAWDYFGDRGDVRFEATFAPVPLPAALPLLAAGLGALVIARRRRTA